MQVHHDEPKTKPNRSDWPFIVFLLGAMIIIAAFIILMVKL